MEKGLVITRNVLRAVPRMTALLDKIVLKINAKLPEAAQLVEETENQMEEDAEETRTVQMVFAVVSGQTRSVEIAVMINTAINMVENGVVRKTNADQILQLVLQMQLCVNKFYSFIVIDKGSFQKYGKPSQPLQTPLLSVGNLSKSQCFDPQWPKLGGVT